MNTNKFWVGKQIIFDNFYFEEYVYGKFYSGNNIRILIIDKIFNKCMIIHTDEINALKYFLIL